MLSHNEPGGEREIMIVCGKKESKSEAREWPL